MFIVCPDGFVKCNYSLGQCVPANGVCQPDYACDGGENNRHCCEYKLCLIIQFKYNSP